MNLKGQSLFFIVQICPLLVYGTVKITTIGTQIIGEKLSLKCILSLSSFSGTATWAQDENVYTTCTNSVCTDDNYGIYTTFSSGSNYINVTFDPVHSSIDGVWTCTHVTLGSDSFNVTAMNETQTPSTSSTTPGSGDTSTPTGNSSGNTSTPTGNGSGGTSTSTGNKGIVFVMLFVFLLANYSMVDAVCFCTRSTANKFKNKFFDCCGSKSSLESEDDPGFFKDKVLTLNASEKFRSLRNLTTGRPLPRRPDIASPQTGPFDSVNSPRPIVLAPIENPNIPPSIDTLDEQKAER